MAAALLDMVREGKRKGMDQLAHVLAPYVRDSKHGACYAWGSGSNFQLGETCAFVSKNKAAPRQVLELPADLCAVVTSKLHSAVISASGTVWASGWTSGPGDQKNARGSKVRLGFHPIEGLDRLRVTCLAVSDHHTLAVVDSGGVYAWGNNKNGQLGLSVTGSKEAVVEFEGLPKRLAEVKHVRIISAAAAARHSLLVQSDGCVWTFGSNKHGALGHSLLDDCCPVPRRVESLRERQIQCVSAAENYSALASRAQSASPSVYVMGRGKCAAVRVSLPFNTTQLAQLLAQNPAIQVHAQDERTWLLIGGQLLIVQHTITSSPAPAAGDGKGMLGARAFIPRCARAKKLRALAAPQSKGRALVLDDCGALFEVEQNQEAVGGKRSSSRSNLSALPSQASPTASWKSPGSPAFAGSSPHSKRYTSPTVSYTI